MVTRPNPANMMWSRGKPKEALLNIRETYIKNECLGQEEVKALSKDGLKLWVQEISKKEIQKRSFEKMESFIQDVLKEREENFPDYRFYCGFYCVPIDIKSMTRTRWDSEGFGDFDFEWPECVYRQFHRSKTEFPIYSGANGENAYIGLLFASGEVLDETKNIIKGN